MFVVLIAAGASAAHATDLHIPPLMRTVVDDLMAVAPSGLWENHTYRGSGSLQCQQTIGWADGFRFLNHVLIGDQEAPLTFDFDPPEDGCYAVEEFHHGGVCNHELASTKAISIHFCNGGRRTYEVSQLLPGNRWHTVAVLPFFQGSPSKVVVTHVRGSTGFTTADAFRFTRIADRCSSSEAKLVQYQEIAQNPHAITLDDAIASINGFAADAHNCGATSFLQDAFAVSDGDASAAYSFMPQASGCFRVEEFHPDSCALAAHAQVQVNYCLGGVAEKSVQLAQRGGQWNTLGHWPFYAGVVGSITSRRLGEQPGALWVADAFRVTKVSDSCWSIPESLQFRVSIGAHLDLNVTNDTWLTPMADVRLSLAETVTRFSDLDHNQVRLQGLRHGAVAEFEFVTSVPTATDAVHKLTADLAKGDESELRSLLCTVVGATHPCEVEIWCDECIETTEEDEAADLTWLVAVIAGLCSVSFGLCVTIVMVRGNMRRVTLAEQAVTEVQKSKEMEVVVPSELSMGENPAALKDEAGQSDAGSTAPPSDCTDELASAASSRHMSKVSR